MSSIPVQEERGGRRREKNRGRGGGIVDTIKPNGGYMQDTWVTCVQGPGVCNSPANELDEYG